MPKNLTPADLGLTLLDVLSSMENSPEMLKIRAKYWEGVAVRHDRHERFEQATRLRSNARAMRQMAREIENRAAVKKAPAKKNAKKADVSADAS